MTRQTVGVAVLLCSIIFMLGVCSLDSFKASLNENTKVKPNYKVVRPSL